MALTAFLCSTDSSVGEDGKKDFKYLKMSKSSTQSPPSPLNDSKKSKSNPFRRKPRGHTHSEAQIIEHPNRNQQGKKKTTSKSKNGVGNKLSTTPQQSIAGSLANGLKQNGSRFLKSHHPFKKNLKNKKESKEEALIEGHSSLASTPRSLNSSNASTQPSSYQNSTLRYSASCDSGNGDDLSSSCDSSVILDSTTNYTVPIQQGIVDDSIVIVQEESSSSPEEEVFEDALSNICSDEEYVTPLSSRTSSLTCLNTIDSVTPPDTTPINTSTTPSNMTATPSCTTIPVTIQESLLCTAMPTDTVPSINPTPYKDTPTSPDDTPSLINSDDSPVDDPVNDTLTEDCGTAIILDITLIDQDQDQAQDGVQQEQDQPKDKEALDTDSNQLQEVDEGSYPSDDIIVSPSGDPHSKSPTPDPPRKPITTRSYSLPTASPTATPIITNPRLCHGTSSSDTMSLIPCCSKHPLCYNWVLWYDKLTTGRPQFSDYAAQLQNVSRISSVEMFWSVMNNIHTPSQLPRNANYHFFKEGIRPLWEDSANKKGGKWVISFKTNSNDNTLLDKVWLEMLMALIGEQIEKSHLINGIVLSRRKKGDRIALWTVDSNKSNNLFICKQLLHVIRLACDVSDYGQFVSDVADDRGLFNMVYMLHKDSLKSGTSYQNEAHLTLKKHLQFMIGTPDKN